MGLRPDVDFNLLTNTSAMSCKSWSLPAGPDNCVGYCSSEDSPCHYCYAGGGRYVMKNVVRAQTLRKEWWKNSTSEERVKVLSEKIARLRVPYIRVFDSGDFRNIDDITDWAQIVHNCPKINFWFSTKSWIIPEFAMPLWSIYGMHNAVVRRSALLLDKPAGKHLIPTTAEVHTTGKGCPKQTSGSCGASHCRRCWDKKVLKVVYHLHGYAVKKWNT